MLHLERKKKGSLETQRALVVGVYKVYVHLFTYLLTWESSRNLAVKNPITEFSYEMATTATMLEKRKHNT